MTQPSELLVNEIRQKPGTGRELLEKLLETLRQAGIVGRWKNRSDIKDSSEYARRLRESAQERSK